MEDSISNMERIINELTKINSKLAHKNNSFKEGWILRRKHTKLLKELSEIIAARENWS